MAEKWAPDMTPCMMTDDIAFVGGTPVSVHAFTCEGGIIILDTGFPYMLDGIRENLRRLGWDIRDVRYVIHSHGHIDHYGTTAEIVRLSGAKTLIGREDADIVTGKLDLSWAKELDLEPAETFTPDILFSDGDVLDLGGRKVRCVNAPGHTEGTYALLFDTKVDGIPMTAAMHGGIGVNSMTREFLDSYSLSYDCREKFRRGLRALAAEHVDVVLGNHPQQSGTAEKTARLGGAKNPFVDPDEWRRFLINAEKNLDDMIASEDR